MKRQDVTSREMAHWQGVAYSVDRTGKHTRIELTYAEQKRIVVRSNTPTCGRAEKNHVADLRRACREMGAERHVR